jgi:hypothetical protein
MGLSLTNLKKRLREGFKKSGYPFFFKFTTFLFDLVKKTTFFEKI